MLVSFVKNINNWLLIFFFVCIFFYMHGFSYADSLDLHTLSYIDFLTKYRLTESPLTLDLFMHLKTNTALVWLKSMPSVYTVYVDYCQYYNLAHQNESVLVFFIDMHSKVNIVAR